MSNLLFKASSETLLTIAAEPKRLGVRIGFTSVLHTWGSAMTHHPHVHMIVPGGGISLDGSRWVSSSEDYLLPVSVLSQLFRGKMLAMLKAAHQAGHLQFFGPHAELADRRAFQSVARAALRHEVIHSRGLHRRGCDRAPRGKTDARVPSSSPFPISR